MITADAFLGGQLRLDQPAKGFRAGLDSVFLAAAVPAVSGEHVLEFGSGAGVASLCLARRVTGVRVTGLEIQPDLVRLAVGNAVRNELEDRVRFLDGPVEAPPAILTLGAFDHVMMNPPFFVEGPDDPSPDQAKRLAHSSDEAALARWAGAALKYLKPKGTLTAILPATRLAEMLAALTRGFGGQHILPLWPRAGEPARRVLIGAVKNARGPASLLAGMVLHAPPERHTAEAEAVLRFAAAVGLHGPVSSEAAKP